MPFRWRTNAFFCLARGHFARLERRGQSDMNKHIIGFMSLVGTLAAAAPASADFTIRSLLTGKCLGVASASTADGADVVTFTCDGTLNQTWAAGAFWPSPDNMFTHILNRVNGATSTNRCLALEGVSTDQADNESCNNNSSDSNDKGWWVDYAGYFDVPGLDDPQYCYSFKSKVNTSTVLTTINGQNRISTSLVS
jgi:uncharacterized membrane protein